MRNRYRAWLCHQALLLLQQLFFLSHFFLTRKFCWTLSGHGLITMEKRKMKLKHWSLPSKSPFIFYKKKLQNLRRKLVDKGAGRVEVTITVWWCPPWDWRKVTQSDTERPHFFIHSPLILVSNIASIRIWHKVTQGRSGAIRVSCWNCVGSWIYGVYGLVGCQKVFYESCVKMLVLEYMVDVVWLVGQS